jgi:hypothetical protein
MWLGGRTTPEHGCPGFLREHGMTQKNKKRKRPSRKQIATGISKMLERMDAFRLTGKRPVGTKPTGAQK